MRAIPSAKGLDVGLIATASEPAGASILVA